MPALKRVSVGADRTCFFVARACSCADVPPTYLYAFVLLLHAPQEHSIEYVASTLQHLMADQPLADGAAAAVPAAAAAAAARAGEAGVAAPATAGCEKALPLLVSSEAGEELQEVEGAADVEMDNNEDDASETAKAARPTEDRGGRATPAPPGAHRRLFLISTYGVGKERLLAAAAAATGCRIAVTPRKLATLRCLDLPGGRLGRGCSAWGAGRPSLRRLQAPGGALAEPRPPAMGLPLRPAPPHRPPRNAPPPTSRPGH